MSDAEDLARRFHETYERLAPVYGYATRDASAVPWSQVPDPNRSLMVAVAAELLTEVPSYPRPGPCGGRPRWTPRFEDAAVDVSWVICLQDDGHSGKHRADGEEQGQLCVWGDES